MNIQEAAKLAAEQGRTGGTGMKERYLKYAKESREDTFEIIVKGLTKNEKESLEEVINKEIRRIKYRRHKAATSNLQYVFNRKG